MKRVVEEKAEDFMKIEVILSCFSHFFMTLYGAMTACISCLNFRPVLSGLKSCYGK